MTENKSDDIKAIFDSIRNIGICSALILGLPYVKKLVAIFPDCIATFSLYFFIFFIIVLYFYNLMWSIHITKEKPNSKTLYIGSVTIFTFVISVLSLGVSIQEVWGKIF